MQRFLLTATIALAFAASAPAALVDYYTLADTTATGSGGLTDQSGNSGGAGNLTTTLGTGTPLTPTIVPGIIGNALSFPGTSTAGAQQAYTSTTSFALAYPFTQSVWVRSPNTVTGTDQALNISNIGAPDQYFAMGTTTALAAQIARNPAAGGSPIGNTGANIADGTWHLLTGVYTSATSRSLYLDGKFTSTSTTSVALPSANVRLTIGGLQRSTNLQGNDHFEGTIDDAGYFNNALNAADVSLINGLGRTGGIGLDQLDEAQALLALSTGSSALIGGYTWERVAGLTGTTGDFGGTAAGGNAFIVTDALGNGIQVTAIPEPSSVLLVASGLGVLGWRNLRRRESK
jgi:hypothetical protein